MLIRSTWTVTVEDSAVLPRTYGLALVKQLHQKMGLEFGQESIPSVSFAGLIGAVTSTQDFLTFHPEHPYRFHLCGLNRHSSEAIAALDLGQSLEFLGVNFKVSDPEIYCETYEDLYQRFVANDPDPTLTFKLEYLTPTAFSQDGLYLPLPVPKLMFRSWLERWNHFAPIYLGSDELIQYLGSAIALKRHSLKTRGVRIKNGFVTGFLGSVTLQVVKRSDPLLANVAHLLIHYAQFSGTGIKTRLGLGSLSIED